MEVRGRKNYSISVHWWVLKERDYILQVLNNFDYYIYLKLFVINMEFGKRESYNREKNCSQKLRTAKEGVFLQYHLMFGNITQRKSAVVAEVEQQFTNEIKILVKDKFKHESLTLRVVIFTFKDVQ